MLFIEHNLWNIFYGLLLINHKMVILILLIKLGLLKGFIIWASILI